MIKGDYEKKTVYQASPLEAAQGFERAGLKRVHIVDLEGAEQGQVKNWETVAQITSNTKLLIEFGGGIREKQDIERMFQIGVDRVVVGSIALQQPQKLQGFLDSFGSQRIVVALDIKGNETCYQAWQKQSRKSPLAFLSDLTCRGVEVVIVTDVERDGSLEGPNFQLYQALTKRFPNLRIIASGGVANKDDLEVLGKTGVEAAIVGKAIYEGKISLKIDRKVL